MYQSTAAINFTTQKKLCLALANLSHTAEPDINKCINYLKIEVHSQQLWHARDLVCISFA